MRQATGSNTPQSGNKVSIQLSLDGHSFSVPALSELPAGEAPVTVELEASASQQSAYEPDGQIRHSEVASTVSVPLGEWTVVARSGRTAQQTRSGTLSTEAVDDSQSEQLAIRVTAP